MKSERKLRICIDHSIKVGDTVRLHDGSALSVKDNTDIEPLIICSYQHLTKSLDRLKDLNATVTEVGLEDTVCVSDISAYIQDIVIDINGCKFRTASQFVYKTSNQ